MRTAFFAALVFTLIVVSACSSEVGAELSPQLEKGYLYLENNLNPELNLICESPDDPNPELRQTYWLANDNLFASHALLPYNPELAASIMASIEKYGYRHDHYVETLFKIFVADPALAVSPEPKVIEKRDYTIKTEQLTGILMDDSTEYFDKLCYQILWAEWYLHKVSLSGSYFDQALEMWDGKGFIDKAYNPQSGYCTYKLALFYFTAKNLNRLDRVPFKDQLVSTLYKLQNANGGFHTFYSFDSMGQLEVRGSTNTETTSLILLALN